jgi:uncharacterized protein (TIGR00297 family)
MPILQIVLITLLIAASYASYKTGKLTGGGAITGGVVALCIYLGAGYTGIAMLATFFVLATLATSHKKQEKRNLDEGTHSQKRDARQVLANGGLAGLSGLMALIMPYHTLLVTVSVAAALASAMADTLSSELGVVYGRRFYNILNLKPGKKGSDGVISLEGTLIGLGGSAAIAAVYALAFGWNRAFFIILIAGTIGNLADSILGATLERNGYMNNNEVNFLNTVIAVITACLLLSL